MKLKKKKKGGAISAWITTMSAHVHQIVKLNDNIYYCEGNKTTVKQSYFFFLFDERRNTRIKHTHKGARK